MAAGLAVAALLLTSCSSGDDSSTSSPSTEGTPSAAASPDESGSGDTSSPDDSGSASEPTAEAEPSPSPTSYLGILVDGTMTTKAICSSYKKVINTFTAEAKRRIAGAKGKHGDAWAAARFRKYNQWVKADHTERFETALTKAGTDALNDVSDGQAGTIDDLDAYITDSIDGCGLTKQLAEARKQVRKETTLGSQIVASARNKPWYPKGYTEYFLDDNLAWKWTDERCGYSYGYCWTIRVKAKDGCYSGLYGEINILDGGVNIGYTNDYVSLLRAGGIAKLEFVRFSGNGTLTGQLNRLTCN